MNPIKKMAWAAVVLAAGCATVDNAREAQRSVAPKGCDESAPGGEAFCLSARSLEDLVGFALTNRPSVVTARLAVEDARLALKALAADAPLASGSPWTSPKLSLSADYSESSRGTTMSEHDFNTDGGPSAGLSLDVLVWDFGRYASAAAAQRERVVAAELALAEEGFRVFDDVSRAYFGFLEQSALAEVALTNRFECAAHLERADSLFEAGEAKRLDVLKAKHDLAAAREQVVAASNAVKTAAVGLLQALGLEASRGRADDFAALGATALANLRRAFPESSGGEREIGSLALTNAPAVRIARARLRASESDVDAAVADLLPRLSASVGLRWSDPLWMWNWGVGAVQSLFQGFAKTTAVDRRVVAMRIAAAEVDAATTALAGDVALAVAERDNAREAFATARDSLAQAAENLRVVREEYEVGEADRVDYATAVSDYVAGLGSCVGAFYRGQRAEGAIFRLTGTYPTYREERVGDIVK